MAELSRLPGPVSESWAWQMRGSCRGRDSALFFHPEEERGSQRLLRAEQAKKVCRECPVLVECRSHALRVQEPYGIWGAMDEGERRMALRHRRKAS